MVSAHDKVLIWKTTCIVFGLGVIHMCNGCHVLHHLVSLVCHMKLLNLLFILFVFLCVGKQAAPEWPDPVAPLPVLPGLALQLQIHQE